jgi:hypothetical protein
MVKMEFLLIEELVSQNGPAEFSKAYVWALPTAARQRRNGDRNPGI